MSGFQLKNLRRINKLTQNDLAKKLGVSRQALCMWESEKRELKATTLKKISKIFSVPIDAILDTKKNKSFKKENKKMNMKKPEAKTTSSAIKEAAFVSRTAAVQSKAEAKTKKIEFKITAPNAKKVTVAGDFNSWDTTALPLKKSTRGEWTGDLTVAPGKYEYKFIVDNEWRLDPNNSKTSWSKLGSQNSLIELN